MSEIGHTPEARSTNFIMTIGNRKGLRLACQTTNLTEATLNFTPFGARMKDLKIPSDKVLFGPLTIDFVISEDYNEWIELFKWMMTCKNSPPDRYEDYVEACELTMLDSQNQPIVSFIYQDAWPTSLEGTTYAVNDTGSNVITSSCTFEYNKFKIKLKDGTEIDESYID